MALREMARTRTHALDSVQSVNSTTSLLQGRRVDAVQDDGQMCGLQTFVRHAGNIKPNYVIPKKIQLHSGAYRATETN